MKRFSTVLLIFILISSAVYSDASYIGVGEPTRKGNTTVLDLNFTYDPISMQRLTFGFTDREDLTWLDSTDDFGDRFFNLRTAYVRDNITYGYGNINFYWKLKTTNTIDARLYLEGPLHDPSTGVSLDWTLAFEPKANNNSDVAATTHVDSYGIENSKTIYTKDPLASEEVQIGYVPVRIKTAESDPSVGDQNYIGTVGVLVEIR